MKQLQANQAVRALRKILGLTQAEFAVMIVVDEQLAQRRFRAVMTQEYRDWRAMARGNPEGLKAAGFKDGPDKGEKEELRLELELVPGWVPGRSMKPPRPAVMTLAPHPASGVGTPPTTG